VEPEPRAGAGAQAILDDWGQSRSLKFGFQSCRNSLLGKRFVQIIHCFFCLQWAKSFWSRSQKLLHVGVGAGAGAKTLDAWSQSLSLKFEFWLHSPDRKYICHCGTVQFLTRVRCIITEQVRVGVTSGLRSITSIVQSCMTLIRLLLFGLVYVLLFEDEKQFALYIANMFMPVV